MAESLVVSGLVSKRAEITGQIASYKTEITRLQDALSHLDGSIKLFAPDFDLRTIKSKRTYKRNSYFLKGEAQRMTLDVLRVAPKPLTSLEIAQQLVQAKDIEPTDDATARIRAVVFNVMIRLANRKIVQEHKGAKGIKAWSVA
jgi:energy-converting hydrogenase Eha subunit G